ncbi:MAG: 6-pyruvoyltetrahydropterin/6-carboxytetrahydropterin synthase, partial [Lysobacterales bacterium]
ASAHFLRGYEGKCKNLHGHTWKIEVFIQKEELDDLGMVADFAILKKQLKEFLMQIDHVNLNDIEYFKTVNPTAENLAKFIYENFAKVIAPLSLKKVHVWESERAYATYYV